MRIRKSLTIELDPIALDMFEHRDSPEVIIGDVVISEWHIEPVANHFRDCSVTLADGIVDIDSNDSFFGHFKQIIFLKPARRGDP